MTALLDITGHRFGLLTALRLGSRAPRVMWVCACDCGREIVAQSNNLRSGNTTSCGCTRPEVSRKLWRDNRDAMKLPKPLIDITGMRFGRLVALALVRAATVEHPRTIWSFYCDCGKVTEAESYSVRNGHTQSCGCFAVDRAVETNTTHGHAKGGVRSSEYRSWIAMRVRCTNPKHDKFKYYGGRGIVVCLEWQNDFARFFADMGPKPTPKHTIERDDNDGNYEPGNCRWATQVEQMRNRRRVA